ncbi:MAG: DinB family protein [Actinomycetota bacterium]|nr:DinB family protein [Actinomycetota bacterium]MDH5314246.1 DinB family protein [Actinomycetota bacterium]
MDAVALLLGQHARLHSATVAESEAGSLEDDLLGGIADAELRVGSLPGHNPPVWVWWHIARTEDVLMNSVVIDGEQVFDRDRWAGSLSVERRDIGTGMDAAAVEQLATAVDIPALRAYRSAVGSRTREIVSGFGAEDLDRSIDGRGAARAREAGAFGPGAEWVDAAWQGTTLGFLLGRNLLVHNALHVGEAIVVGPRSI